MPERVVTYQVINQKLDTGFILTAPSLQRLYIDGALALTDFLVQLDRVRTEDTRTLSVAGENREKLMANWITAVLALFEKEHFLARRIVFKKFDGKQIEASLFGEKFDSIRHGGSPHLKALVPQEFQVSDKMDPEPQFSLKVILGIKQAA